MENKSIPQSQSSLGLFGIVRETFKTTSRNGKLLVPILALVFLLFCQLDFAQKYVIAPVSKDFVLQLAKHPNMVHDYAYSIDKTTYVGALNDAREILLVKLLIMAISSIITLVFLFATVSSSSEAYTAKLLSPIDLFLKIRKSCKRPLVTNFYMILLTLGLTSLYAISIAITSILAVNSWAVLFFGAIALSSPFCYVYVSSLWTVSVVVSVIEEGVGGLKAIGRASELMKGKRFQGSLMMVLFTIAYSSVHLMANALTNYNLSRSTQLAITIPFTNGLYCWLQLLMFVMFTIFYHELKTGHDDKQGKGYYVPIACSEA